MMNNGFLSQEEIDALLNGSSSIGESEEESSVTYDDEILSEIEKDVLGEMGNISMGSASTALSQILGHKVNITTPRVYVTSLNEIKKNFEVPNIVLDVTYTSGIIGANLLLMKITDAAIVANLMMGGDGKVETPEELSEIEVSAVSEAMNQMIGSAATAMATMFAREVNISPPKSKIYYNNSESITEAINDDDNVIQVLFELNVDGLIDSNIMQILPVTTAKKIISIMMGTEENVVKEAAPMPVEEPKNNYYEAPKKEESSVNNTHRMESSNNYATREVEVQRRPEPLKEINVKEAAFEPLGASTISNQNRNIDLILDVPLQVSVELGKTKMSIKDVLELGNGSLIELDKLTEEPVEVLINGKRVAYGEVVVVDENFGVRITGIISNEERIKSLGR